MKSLIRTKLRAPPPRAGLVPRPHLLERLSSGLNGRLTLICAPAGYGKTSLANAWLDTLPAISDYRSAWLSLDESDSDPVLFLAYLVNALQQIESGLGRHTLSLLHSPTPPPTREILITLVNDIAAMQTPSVLVLDDYHVVETPAIHQHHAFLLEHQPPHMHQVIVTRRDPPLPLTRLRAGHQMTEVRQADLRFSMAETTAFLRESMALDISPEDIATLSERTEGWVAGLQLAAIAMRSLPSPDGSNTPAGPADLHASVKSFAGSNRLIIDYLFEEVLQRQPEALQDFLLRTSLLNQLNGPLCTAVTGNENSARLLRHLVDANLFVIPLDQTHAHFRYHRLFADLLRHRLSLVDPSAPATLHRRASRWFEQAANWPEAIHHALAEPDWERAVALIGQISQTMLRRGEVATLLRWLDPLPAGLVCNRPQLCLDYGWALLLSGRPVVAEPHIDRAEALAGEDAVVAGRILVARAYLARLRGDYGRAVELAQKSLAALPKSEALQRSLVALTLGLAHWSDGRLPAAEEALRLADRAARQSRNHYARLSALSFLAEIQAMRGRLRRAAAICRQAIRLGGQAPTVAQAHVTLGALLFEWHDLPQAADHLLLAIALSKQSGNAQTMCDGLRALARVQQALGDETAVLTTLESLSELEQTHELTPLARARNAACQAEIALITGELPTAVHWAKHLVVPADASSLYPTLALTPARLLLARLDRPAAARRLAQLYATAVDAGWRAAEIEVRILQALAADLESTATRFLADALRLAQSERFIRPFVSKGAPLLPLLQMITPTDANADFVSMLQTLMCDLVTRTASASPPAEALSEREMEIVRLLADGLSNQDIADRLFISVGTVKTHVHHVLGKLTVSNRAQAVARCRELTLL